MIKTDAIAGCASIMKTERLKKIGLSDPDFFMERKILNYPIGQLKVKLWVDLDEKVYHHVSGTVGKNWAKMSIIITNIASSY